MKKRIGQMKEPGETEERDSRANISFFPRTEGCISLVGMYIKIPTELTNEQIEEYQRIYFEVYEKEIPKEKASIEALDVIRLVAIVIGESGKTI